MPTIDLGSVVGPPGPQGLPGKDGITISGQPGQVVGFSADGQAVAQDIEKIIIEKSSFTIKGPLSAGELFTVGFSGAKTKTMDGTIIYFGPKIQFPRDYSSYLSKDKGYQFELLFVDVTSNRNPTIPDPDTYGMSLHMKALTSVPEGVSVPMDIVWIP